MLESARGYWLTTVLTLSLLHSGCGGENFSPDNEQSYTACRQLARCNPCGMSVEERFEHKKETSTNTDCKAMLAALEKECEDPKTETCDGQSLNCSACELEGLEERNTDSSSSTDGGGSSEGSSTGGGSKGEDYNGGGTIGQDEDSEQSCTEACGYPTWPYLDSSDPECKVTWEMNGPNIERNCICMPGGNKCATIESSAPECNALGVANNCYFEPAQANGTPAAYCLNGKDVRTVCLWSSGTITRR